MSYSWCQYSKVGHLLLWCLKSHQSSFKNNLFLFIYLLKIICFYLWIHEVIEIIHNWTLHTYTKYCGIHCILSKLLKKKYGGTSFFVQSVVMGETVDQLILLLLHSCNLYTHKISRTKDYVQVKCALSATLQHVK